MSSPIAGMLYELLEDGAFRFEGRHEAVMDTRGRFSIPEDWTDLVSSDDPYQFITVYDEINGQILVYFAEDEPEQSDLYDFYLEFTKKATKLGSKLRADDLNPYMYMNYFDKVYVDGSLKISPKVLRGVSLDDLKTKTVADKQSDIVLEGFGYGFTIERSDGAWKRDRNLGISAGGPLWDRVLALRPVINGIRALRGMNALEREVYATIHPSGHEQNQRGPGCDGV